MEMWNAKGFGGDRKAPKKSQDKSAMEKKNCEGAWLEIRRSLRPQSPQKPHYEPAMEMWNAKGFGGDRKAPKIRKPNLLWKRKLRRDLA